MGFFLFLFFNYMVFWFLAVRTGRVVWVEYRVWRHTAVTRFVVQPPLSSWAKNTCWIWKPCWWAHPPSPPFPLYCNLKCSVCVPTAEKDAIIVSHNRGFVLKFYRFQSWVLSSVMKQVQNVIKNQIQCCNSQQNFIFWKMWRNLSMSVFPSPIRQTLIWSTYC